MSYAYEYDVPVSQARPNERADFIRKTYLHLAGAIFAFVALEAAIFATFGIENIMRFVIPVFARSNWSALIVMGLFVGAGYLAQMWAQSRTSKAMQYMGLGLYVIAEALIFLPILAIAQYFVQYEGVIQMAAILTLGIVAGLTTVGFVTKKDFSFLAPILSIGFFLSLGVIVCAILFGFQLGLWFSFIMVALAAASIIYTTSNILLHYSTDMYVAAALELFAAVATLFFWIMRILMQMRDR